MKRKRGAVAETRKHTDEEFAAIHAASKATIEQLCKVYDEGHPYIAFTLAAEIHKFLTASHRAVSIRNKHKFPSVRSWSSSENLAPEHKLIVARVSSQPNQTPRTFVEFLPVLDGGPTGLEQLDFVDWWNRDIVWRAGAIPVSPGGVILPRTATINQKRESYVRRELITLVRNTLGSHLDHDIPKALDELQKSNTFGVNFIAKNEDGEEISTDAGTLPMKTGPLAAMVRQIAFEVLKAFEFDGEN